MKFKLYAIRLFIILFAASGITCRSSGKTFKGTIIVSGCSVIGIDIDGPAGTGGGGKCNDHQNSATVKNFCLFAGMQLKLGDRISFKVSDTNVEPGAPCVSTFCLIDSPSNQIFVSDVDKLN